MTKKVAFGICADLHTDFIHDSVERMKIFLEKCREYQVDFCVELGDFCQPGTLNEKEKQEILGMLEVSGLSCFHVLGNHDMDEFSKEQVLEYLGGLGKWRDWSDAARSESHASFDCGGIHFVLLDANYYRVGEEYFPYDHGNYKLAPPEAQVPVLPPSELVWLEEDLAQTSYPTVVFSHQSLIESRTGIRNPEDFRKVIRKAPAGVCLAVCGHEHVDRLECKEGVWYYCLNSMSYYWAGGNFDHSTYGEEIEADHPLLRCVFPYKDPLFCIVEIDAEGIQIRGTASEIVGAAPEELAFRKQGLVDPVTASVQDRRLPFVLND